MNISLASIASENILPSLRAAEGFTRFTQGCMNISLASIAASEDFSPALRVATGITSAKLLVDF